MSARIFEAFFLKHPSKRERDYLLQTFVLVLVPSASHMFSHLTEDLSHGDVRGIIILILQMRRLRLREVNGLPPSRITSR